MKTRRVKWMAFLAVTLFVTGCEDEFPPEMDFWLTGLGISYSRFPEFEATLGDQTGIASATSNSSVTQWGARVEANYGRNFAGMSGRFGRHEILQTFQPGEGRPDRTDGTVNGYFLDTYGGRTFPLSSILKLRLMTGPTLAYNAASFRWRLANEVFEDSRSHFGLKWNTGVSLDFGLARGWYGRVGAHYVNILNSDADNHSGLSFSVLRAFNVRQPEDARRQVKP